MGDVEGNALVGRELLREFVGETVTGLLKAMSDLVAFVRVGLGRAGAGPTLPTG